MGTNPRGSDHSETPYLTQNTIPGKYISRIVINKQPASQQIRTLELDPYTTSIAPTVKNSNVPGTLAYIRVTPGYPQDRRF